jgi:hypothetical protein
VGFGSPLLADATFQLAYPPTWLALALPPAAQFKLFAIGHCLFAAAGAAALARRLGLGWTAAGVAGGAYAMSGPVLSAVSLFHHYAGAAWLPWLLAALEGLVRRPGVASALWLGLAGGAQILAGSGDLCLAGALLGTGRLVWHLVRGRPRQGRVLALAGSGAGAAALALALGAVQWLPTAEKAREGFRTVQDPRTSAYWSLHPASLADLAVPRLVTTCRRAGFPGALFEAAAASPGVLSPRPSDSRACGLGLGAPGAWPPPAGAGLLFFLVAALGRTLPPPPPLGLPGFGDALPQKLLWPAALCAAVLAAVGRRPGGTPSRRPAGPASPPLLLTAAGQRSWLRGGSPAPGEPRRTWIRERRGPGRSRRAPPP